MHHSASALHAFAAWWHAYASMSRYTSACLRLRIYVTLYVCLSTLTHLCHSMSALHAIAAWWHAYASMSRYTSACLRLRIYVTLCLPRVLSQRDRMPTHLCHAIRLPVYAYASMSLCICLACYRSVIACLPSTMGMEQTAKIRMPNRSMPTAIPMR